MNWKEIKEKYPRSYNLIYQQAREYANVLYESPIRWLYDFFDIQEIFVVLDRDWEFVGRCGEETEYLGTWNWELQNSKGWIGGQAEGHGIKSRTETEEQAFLKAFEILESKL